MKFERNYFIIISLLGAILLLTYFNFIQSGKNNDELLWGRIKNNLRKVYYGSMFLTILSFLIILYYLYITEALNYNNSLQILITISAIIILSMFWMPLSLKYITFQLDKYKVLITAILLFVSIASLLLSIEIYKINEKKYVLQKNIAFAAAIYFFFHTFVLDTIIWTQYFF
jgi:lipid-A-disaccharide synthase-like uncharacterized protein